MSGRLKALLVLGCNEAIWTKEAQLPIPPFPGLGIRIGVYDMLNVERVVIGDDGFDVTCICTVEEGVVYDAYRLRSFGFQEGAYP
jgi:hypothetical protein